MNNLLQDLKYAVRMLAKTPGFTAIAVVTLALGIGANTTIFSWVNGFLLNGYPGVPDAQRMVILSSAYRGANWSLSYPDYQDFRDRADKLDIAVMDMAPMSLKVGEGAERVWGKLVNGNYFQALGVRPALGRAFLPEEDKTLGTHPVVVIGHGLWQRRFAGDPGIVGREIWLNNTAFTVVGVAPEDFHGTFIGLTFDVYAPVMMHETFNGRSTRLTQRGNHWLDAVAKLKPGVSLREAQAQLDVISQQLGEAYPNTNKDVVGTLYPVWKAPYGATQVMGPVLLVLSGVVGLVLLIACANLANLLLARATVRRREIAIRLSLGASRARLVRQLLTESVLLALAGGALGILLGVWSWDLLLSFMPAVDLPIAVDQGMNRQVLGFTLGLSVLTGLLFGLAPALEASGRDVAHALKDETGTGSARKGRLRSALVVAQVALSLLLLISSGLLLRSLEHAQSVRLGFNPDGVLLANIDLFPNGYTPETGRAFQQRLHERLRALPGAEVASLARRVPLGFGGASGTSIVVEGYTAAKDESVFANYNQVTPDYFRTMGTELRRGRDFTDGDTLAAPLVAVINEAMAARYWAGREALGGRFRLDKEWVTVAGVVETSKYRQLNEPPRPFFFLPLAQAYRPDVTLQVRTAGDPGALSSALRAEVSALDPILPVFNVTTLNDHIRAASFQQRLGGSLLAGFGALALALAAIGIYGVMSFGVAQRTREIGVRMALGARRGDILRLVLGYGMRLAGIGLAIGMVVAFAASNLLGGLLLGVSARDPITFAGVAGVLGAVALAATYVPARRATRVDPMVALRHE